MSTIQGHVPRSVRAGCSPTACLRTSSPGDADGRLRDRLPGLRLSVPRRARAVLPAAGRDSADPHPRRQHELPHWLPFLVSFVAEDSFLPRKSADTASSFERHPAWPVRPSPSSPPPAPRWPLHSHVRHRRSTGCSPWPVPAWSPTILATAISTGANAGRERVRRRRVRSGRRGLRRGGIPPRVPGSSSRSCRFDLRPGHHEPRHKPRTLSSRRGRPSRRARSSSCDVMS